MSFTTRYGIAKSRAWFVTRALASGLAACAGAIIAASAPALAQGPAGPSCQNAPPPRTVMIAPGHEIGGPADEGLLARGEVILTFDDGPDPVLTPRILDILAKACTPATFFVLGSDSREHPGLLKRILREGHSVGGHGDHHDYLPNLPHAVAVGNITDGFEALRDAGVTPRLFRFPHLVENDRLVAWLSEQGVAVVGVDIDARDWSGASAQETMAVIERELAARGGGVILLHDIQPVTAEILPGLLAMLAEKNFRIVRLRGLGAD